MNLKELSDEEFKRLKKACCIAAEALAFGKSLVKRGESIFEITKKIDDKIIKLGGNNAFPTQISLNETAAHFCPTRTNDTILDNHIVKIDVGVHLDGLIGDNACTVDLSGEHDILVKATEEALDKAIKALRPDIEVREIGQVIEETISSYGLSPIRNLGGHGLGKYLVHDSPLIPNYDNGNRKRLCYGDIIAIEPFATNGSGIVIESSNPTIFSLKAKKPLRDFFSRKILNHIERNYKNLPFSQWWLEEKFPSFRVNLALKEMRNLNIVESYPPLIDRAKGMVSQAEHTILIKEKAVVLTKLN